MNVTWSRSHDIGGGWGNISDVSGGRGTLVIAGECWWGAGNEAGSQCALIGAGARRWGPGRIDGGCEGDTETRPLVYRDSLRQGQAEQM